MADNSDDLIISISTDLATVRRSLKRLEADIAASSSKVEKQFDGMGKGIDKSMSTALQARIEKMVGIGTQGAKEWSGALADQGKELERLRAKYNPLFSTINNYKQSIADIRRAHSIGAISATEMTAAITKERQAALASTAAIKGRNAALADTPAQRSGAQGVSSYNTSNIAAQFQDIGVTAMGGMSPLQIALQQGTQLSAVFNDLKSSGSSLGSALGAAFASVVSPISLVTIGVVAASAAAIQYFSSIEWGGAKSAETLKKEAELISAVSQKWGEALPALKAYNDERERAQQTKDIKGASAVEADNQWADLRKKIEDLNIAMTDTDSQLQQLGKDEGQVGNLQRDFAALQEAISKGSATSEMAKKVLDDLRALMADGTTPAVDAFAKSLTALPDLLDEASKKAGELKKQGDDLAATLEKVARFGKGVGAQDGVQDYRLRDQLRRQEENANPTVTNPQGVTVAVPVPGQKPVQLGEEPAKLDAASKKAETSAEKARNAYRDLIKSANDRIEQMRLELEITGQYGTVTDAARFRLQLLQDAQDKGRTIGDKERAEIETRVAAYAGYSEALAKAKLQQDLLTDARMRGMSAQDQKIVQMQRQYGLQEDPNSATGQAIARSLQLDEIQSASDQFIDNLSGALLSGGEDIGKKLGDMILQELLSSAQKQLSGILKQVFGALLPGGAGPSAAPSSVGAIGSVASAAAPAGSVVRGGSAVDLASNLLGQSERSPGNINAFLKKGGVDINAAQTAWCAGFVNSSLEQVGVKGSGSLTANSFQNWGTKIAPGLAQKGDVLLQTNGFRAGQSGGHVGFATGATRVANGQQQLQMLSGNSSDSVMNSWVSATEVQVRRSTEAAGALAKVAQSSGAATQGLGSLANNLGSDPASGGGGLFSWLGSLFGGSPSKGTGSGTNYFPPAPKLAEGGRVRGPGTGTSDSIVALLSNGEHVTRAAMVAKHGPLLDAINADRVPRFAEGGLVRRVGAPVAPSLNKRQSIDGGQNTPRDLNVNVSGASGDPHVRELVRQGVQEALAADREQQRRGGFGNMQSKFASQKG
ncbi:hypothetical protein ASG25_02005 [Rhizobium sp. Leaf384]|uniref:phage tail length tape measure family protein n=1 Tax=unclassified Rhizobium TaxID=2613769 RepID=UPI0007143E18|nr:MULTISPECIES: phage tail length tape measure family protein [unclassified Rhizobium]KQS74213.1 hypothetical protein ASG58_17070 [Rhizobium sp. Leaf383]KQS80408.1 hypothetical protein ASG25_02005 [Rhizobium sp. Leaf384]